MAPMPVWGRYLLQKERFQQWRVIDAEQDLDPLGKFRELETLIRGVFDQKRLLDFIRSFCLFEDDEKIIKKIAPITSSMPFEQQWSRSSYSEQTRW